MLLGFYTNFFKTDYNTNFDFYYEKITNDNNTCLNLYISSIGKVRCALSESSIYYPGTSSTYSDASRVAHTNSRGEGGNGSGETTEV